MRKRERENPCGICGHYHKYEEGEVCGVCGHRPPAAPAAAGARQLDSAFPSEILKEFLFLGSYDNASRSELLKTIGVSHILNVCSAPLPSRYVHGLGGAFLILLVFLMKSCLIL